MNHARLSLGYIHTSSSLHRYKELGENMQPFTLVGHCPGLLSAAVVIIKAKSTWGRGALLAYTYSSMYIIEENQGRNLE